MKKTVVVFARMELPPPGMDEPQTINSTSSVLIRALPSAREEENRELRGNITSDLTCNPTGTVDF